MRLIPLLILALTIAPLASARADDRDLTSPVLSAAECEKAPDDTEYLRQSAEAGDTTSQSELANIIMRGSHGFEKNSKEALKWMRKSAEGGDEYAQFFLGVLYAPDVVQKVTGESELGAVAWAKAGVVAPDDAESVKWFQKAAMRGHYFSQENLGLFYRDGRGVTQDYSEAYFWMTLSHHIFVTFDKNILRVGDNLDLSPEQTRELEDLTSHLSTQQIEANERRVKAWRSAPILEHDGRDQINVFGILCGNSNSAWKIVAVDGDIVTLRMPDIADAGFLNVSKLTKKVVGGGGGFR